ncbi:hypothetical protein BRE01_65660 [Brevibacillus reuszeri]|nr:hypothetical protein BRE01_65660 [Brevibacillus reuszeri]
METKIDSITDVQVVAEKAKDTANKALQYGKSTHKRLDEIKDNQKWH